MSSKDRREFLKTACMPVVLAAFGISVLEACSTEEDDDSYEYGASGSTSNPSDPLKLDISSSDFNSLQTVGGWLNFTSKNILLVRISETEIRVFDNKCPHQGNRDKWTYNGSQFTCGYHNNSYSDSCSGALTCYDAELEGNNLTITF